MRLGTTSLRHLGPGIQVPQYDRRSLQGGIVHLGIGHFHRAHQAWYTHRTLQQHPSDWMITGVSLQSSTTRDWLVPQEGLYTLVTQHPDRDDKEIIGSIIDVLGPDDHKAVFNRLCDPSTRIVSLTVTEKGYLIDPRTQRLDIRNPLVQVDLITPGFPCTPVGWLVRSLEARRKAGSAPFAVLSCDNLAENGRQLKRAVLDFAAEIDGALEGWIEQHVTFPCSMVDRIVPATTAQQKLEYQAKLGYEDQGLIVTEPFSQWVLEDSFPAGRPRWEDAGAICCTDVAPFEGMKLGLLNGAHSSMAYLGCLMGHETVADCMADPVMRSFTAALMHRELAPAISPPPGYDVTAYLEILIQRFENPRMRHKCRQIAMDGSQKIPQRLFGALYHQMESGRSIARLATVLAAWMIYVSGQGPAGETISVEDPQATRFAALAAGLRGNPESWVVAMLEHSGIFPTPLQQSGELRMAVTAGLAGILAKGVQDTLVDLNKGH